MNYLFSIVHGDWIARISCAVVTLASTRHPSAAYTAEAAVDGRMRRLSLMERYAKDWLVICLLFILLVIVLLYL